ncbi:DUF6541 family protein [Microbacterium thalli]|uniref:DUF6541 family protein n=1 Tax=Microbacterium thalli TaxID=3027921 RepID=UPI002366F09B|nr:DUF6541 family protein [Microbacterium thalli]MDD7930458.1 hypothetical protein [Microbacterium thalli]
MDSWISTFPSILVATLLLLIPGGIVMAAGWSTRNPSRWLLAPAVSVTIAAVAATIAPLVGLRWGLVPLAIVTAIVAGIGLVLRRFAGTDDASSSRGTLLAAVGALIAAAGGLGILFARAFGGPENIAQRFDNIVHLNAIALAVKNGNASPFQIGATSDIGGYPNAWHAITTLVVELTGASVPAGINAANLGFVAILWPASIMVLVGAMFHRRRAAYVVAAALSMGFGAFPALFLNWGVLYPNLVGYAMVPAGLAAVVLALGESRPAGIVRGVLLVALLAGGVFLGHPNAFLALLAFSAATVLSTLLARAIARRTRRDWWTLAASAAGFALVCVVTWSVFRTSAEHSGWKPWQNLAQAFGEAALASPRGYTPTIVIAVLLVAGAVVAVRRPRALPLLAPFAVAVLLFVVASGLRIDHPLREFLTNPWYNDSNRLAALLPMAAIPVAVLGALGIYDAGRRFSTRLSAPRWTRIAALVIATMTVFSVAIGPNTRISLSQVREAYAYTDDASLLTSDERALLDRLPEKTDEDALIIGSPRTGASLALALSDREVTQRHIFGSPAPELVYLNSHLRNIDSDPDVCSTVDDLGIDYVLDFGRQDVMDQEQAVTYDGVQDLTPGRHLVLVDSEGPDARLFRIEGC